MAAAFLVFAKIVVLLLGTAVASLALLAYRRTRRRSMFVLGVGFALMAIGSFVEGLLFEFLGWDLVAVHFVESAFSLAGLGTVATILRPRRARR